jgi:hypothetical protein
MTFEHDRPAQLVMSADPELDYFDARLRLERASLWVRVPEVMTDDVEAAVLCIAACGVRMFKGGVFLEAPANLIGRLGAYAHRPLTRALATLGVRPLAPPTTAFRLNLGVGEEADLHVWTDGWSGAAGPSPPAGDRRPGNALSGMLSGALAVSIAFRRAVLGDVLAGRRLEQLSAWGRDESSAPEPLAYLPRALWLLGMGNLGQATLFGLSLLPFHDRGEVQLVLQDFDIAGPENLDAQVLTEFPWVGRRKARQAAQWCEALGFDAIVHERRFGPNFRPEVGDPQTLVIGVDNLETRRWAAASGFPLTLDAGLGATASEAFDLRIHAFPGRRTPDQAWPAAVNSIAEVTLNPGLQRMVDQGRIDRCGAITIAGKSVGVPCTAMAAAALQLGQLCRAIVAGECADLIDVSLAGTADLAWHDMDRVPQRPAFTAP